MNIIVCIKQVPDTAEARMNKETNTIARDSIASIINPFDIYAIEESIRIKEKLGGEVTAISMGIPSVEKSIREAIALGADNGVLLSDRAFAGADTLAPRMSSRLNTGLTADCTGLEIDMEKGLLLQTRPAFGGNIMASIVCPNHRPQMATVRPRVMKALTHDPSRIGKIIKPDLYMPKSIKTNVIEAVPAINKSVNLSEADIIVSAGRGIGGAGQP